MPAVEIVFAYRWTRPDGTPEQWTGTAELESAVPDEAEVMSLVLQDTSVQSGVPAEDISVTRFLWSSMDYVDAGDLSRPGDTGQV